jgi:hypothetical protein
MPKPKRIDHDWEAKVNGARIGSMAAFKSIRKGSIEEEQLDKLQNLMQFSLALMQICGPEKWAQAKFNAELMSYLKEEINDE